ncbi:MAG: hypothetical protein LBI68_11055 [Azoarcus sp.]|nr:hypothetical protein [Azoarcus sp.]
MTTTKTASPARRHRQRIGARIASAAAAAKTAPLATAKPYELMCAKLDSDMRRLKQIQSVAKKIDIKRQLLPEYDAWVDGVLESGAGVQDDVLITVMIWRIDTGDFTGGLRIAEYAINHKLALPQRYQRTLGCLIAEEIADAGLRALAEKRLDDSNEQLRYSNALDHAAALTADADMPDEVRAKLEKALGLVYEQLSYNDKALGHLQRALALNPAAGVKKDIERVNRALRNKAAPETAAA